MIMKQFIKNFDDMNFVNNFIRLNNTLQNLFTYKNVPESLNMMMLENYLHLTLSGTCAIINDDKYGLIAVKGNYGNDVDVYGIGTHFVGANCKKSYDISVNDDNIVMCHNNVTRTSDYYLVEKYANILNEIDKSINSNIVYSRVYPIPRVKNQKEEKQILSIMKSIFKGEVGRIISGETDINTIIEKDNIDVINLTDGNQSNHMDTLIRLKDNVLRNFLREIGINVNTLDKSAQVNNNELQAFITYSNLNLVDYYNERVKFIEECNKKFGLNMSVEYNENLIKQIIETQNTNDSVETDDSDIESGGNNDSNELVEE